MPDAPALKPLGELFLAKKFPQVRALTARDFERHCRNRDVRMHIKLLERLDVEGFLHPLLRVRREKVSAPGSTTVAYSTINTSAESLRLLREQGLVELPEETLSRPWKECRAGREETILVPLYHPLQVLVAEQVQWLDEITFEDSFLKASQEDILRRVVEAQRLREALLGGIRTAILSRERLVRVLLPVEDAFLPDLRGSFTFHGRTEFWEWRAQWAEWRSGLNWQHAVTDSGWTPEEVGRAYETWATRAMSLDPMERWFLLIQSVNYGKRRDLKGPALFAQDLYDVSIMLKWLYEGATGEKLPMPDDLHDVTRGLWKAEWYGTEDVLMHRGARFRLLTEFGLNPIYRVHLILEGRTEDIVVHRLAQALGLDFERLGVSVLVLGGAQKANRGRLEELLHHLAQEGAVPYVILDNDRDVAQHLRDLQNRNTAGGEPLLRGEFCRTWDGEFEDDNFTSEEIANAFNMLAQSLGSTVRVVGSDLETAKLQANQAGEAARITKILGRRARELGLELSGHRERLAEMLAQVAVTQLAETRPSSRASTAMRPIVSEILKVAELAGALERGAVLE